MRLLLDARDLLMSRLIDFIQVGTQSIEQPSRFLGRPSHREIPVGLLGARGGEVVAPVAKPINKLPGLLVCDLPRIASD
ncbi:hypothetical protein GGC64_006329 [Mycobacterium sp. OAS707]|uniref:hypothetical protein n=1 Tax=Mycobacterium sp. OAS707 TaxID=2663822 RepID=UPI0019FD9A11|nr:hypothetical protein [Mycobacterium sp. OAS707]MBE1552242.1 hypothetical protein [Mycobacterium sp. OAS707]